MARAARRRAKASDVKFTGMANLMSSVKEEFGAEYVQPASMALLGDTYIDFGVFTLDLAMVGGIAENKIHMFVGWESGGKTTQALRVAAAAQRKYPKLGVGWLDAEQTLDIPWAAKQGVDVDRFWIANPSKAETLVDIAQGMIATEEVSLLVVDSLPAMVPKRTGENSAFDKQVAERSQVIGVLCSKMLQGIADMKAANKKITIVFINQWRSVIGSMGKGPKKVMPGGHQPRYASATITDFFNVEKQGKDDDDTMSIVQRNTHGFKIRKSKVGNSLRVGEWDMIRDPSHPLGEGGVDDYLAAISYAKRLGLYHGDGSKQHFADEVEIPGNWRRRDDVIKFLMGEPELYTRLKSMTVAEWRRRIALPPVPNDGYLMGLHY